MCLQFVDRWVFEHVIVKENEYQWRQEKYNRNNKSKLHDKYNTHYEFNFFQFDVFFINWKREVCDDKADEQINEIWQISWIAAIGQNAWGKYPYETDFDLAVCAVDK